MDRMNDYIKAMKQTYDLGMGERRTLTEQEEADLVRATELRDAADSLRAAAWELEEQAGEIAPDNLYPNSVWAKVIDRTELPSNAGKPWATNPLR